MDFDNNGFLDFITNSGMFMDICGYLAIASRSQPFSLIDHVGKHFPVIALIKHRKSWKRKYYHARVKLINLEG